MSDIPTFLNMDYLAYGVKSSVSIDLSATAHILVAGQTGSGKTYATRLLLAKIAKYQPDAQITIVDYKQFDFTDFDDTPRYYGYDTAFVGLQQFNDEFDARLSGADKSRNRKILLFDEWSAFMSSLEKKRADEAKAIIQRLLCLGRAYNVTCIIGAQKAMADLFAGGSRDNFGVVILLGNSSKEQRQMLMSDYADDMQTDCPRGQGYMSIAGRGLYHVLVPQYDQAKADTLIRSAMV